MPSFTVVKGDVRTLLADMDDKSVRCCVTSPPYWGLRDYGTDGQLGLEPTPDAYVQNMVEVFRDVRRVLTADGTLWLNLGDSYAANRSYRVPGGEWTDVGNSKSSTVPVGLKPKDLVGIPWRVAFALQADGWYLRSDIIWHKRNPMPERVTDRPTKAHEYLFLLTKSAKYYYDHEAMKEPALHPANKYKSSRKTPAQESAHFGNAPTNLGRCGTADNGMRNRRTVWSINTRPFKGAHFAVMPEALVEPCILAGSAEGDLVLDPFAGSGTVGVVALRHGRDFMGFDLNKDPGALDGRPTGTRSVND
jgi:DNA modification methylase